LKIEPAKHEHPGHRNPAARRRPGNNSNQQRLDFKQCSCATSIGDVQEIARPDGVGERPAQQLASMVLGRASLGG